MAHTVWLHIGAMKSGTTFVQSTLEANRETLAEAGIRFPGTRWRDQVSAVRDVLGQTRDGAPLARTLGAWPRMLEEISQWDGTAVLSMESLAAAGPAKIETVVRGLAPADVRVVLTGRDLARTIPAMWQEAVQNGATWTWPEYLDGVRAGDRSLPGPGRSFWRHQALAGIARRWAAVVGLERLTVVTVPPAGSPPGALWDRFASVVGVDPASCVPAARVNASLGAPSAQVMRALNERLAAQGLSEAAYHRFVKHRLAKRALSERASVEPRVGLDADWVRPRSEALVQRLEDLGVPVVGDLRELVGTAVPGVDPASVDAGDQLDAAVDALSELIRMWSRS